MYTALLRQKNFKNSQKFRNNYIINILPSIAQAKKTKNSEQLKFNGFTK